MSDRDLVRASADFDGWDPDSIFSSSDNAINKCSPATPVKKNNSTAANLNNSRENDRDNTNVIGSKSRGVAGTFLKTASTTGSPDMFGKIMGLDEINSDQNGKQLSEDERLKMMEGERWRRLEKEALSTRAATTLRKEESRLVEQESELDVIRNKNRPQRNENVKTEKSRLIKEATDDLLEDSMDNQRRSEVQEEIRSKEGEILLLRLETERLEKIDLMRNEKERFRRNQDIEKDEERIAFLEAEAESRGLSNSLQGDEDEGDVGDDDSLIGKTETLSRNTGNNSPKSIPSSIPHSPRNVLIDFGESIDLDDSLDVRGQYPIEANSCTANSGDNTTANSGDNTTANSGESSSAVLSFSKNNDYKGNGRDQSTNSGPHLSSSISASIWERGSAARTVQSAYRGVLGR